MTTRHEPSTIKVVKERLRAAIAPYGSHEDDDIDTLLWRVGTMHDQIESAHHWLDMQGAPRVQGDGTLTLRGRMDAMDQAKASRKPTNHDRLNAKD